MLAVLLFGTKNMKIKRMPRNGELPRIMQVLDLKPRSPVCWRSKSWKTISLTGVYFVLFNESATKRYIDRRHPSTSPLESFEMKRTCAKFSLNGYIIILQIGRWLGDVSTYVHSFYVILWEGNPELNINRTYQYLVYYDHEKINTSIVNYGIDSFAFISTLNSHRIDTLGKLKEGFSARRRHFSVAPGSNH